MPRKDLLPRRTSSASGTPPDQVLSVEVEESATRHVMAPLPPASRGDAALLSQLRTVVEQQRRDLDERTDNVNAIQRNFQRLSEMYGTDRQHLSLLEARLAEALTELEALRAERKLHVALQQEFRDLQHRHAALEQSSATEIEALHKEILSLGGRLTETENERKTLRMQVQALEDAAAAAVSGQKNLFHATEMIDMAALDATDAAMAVQQAAGMPVSEVAKQHGVADRRSDPSTLQARLSAIATRLQFLRSGVLHPTTERITAVLAAARREEANLNIELDGLKQASENEQSRLKIRISELEEKLRSVCATVKSSSKLVDEEQHAMKLKSTQLQEKLSAVQGNFDSSQRRNQELQSHLREIEAKLAERESVASAARKSLFAGHQWSHELERESFELVAKLEKMELARSAMVDVQSGVAGVMRQMRKDIGTRAAMLAGVQHEKQLMSIQLATLQEAKKCADDELQDALRKLATERSDQNKREKMWAVERARLESELVCARSSTGKEVSSLLSELESLKRHAESVESAATRQHDSDTAQCARFESLLNSAKHELCDAKHECDTLRAELAHAQHFSSTEVEALRRELDMRRAEVEKVHEELSIAKQQLSKALEEESRLKKQLSGKDNQDKLAFAELQATISALTRDNEALFRAKSALERTLASGDGRLKAMEALKNEAERRAEDANLYSAKLLKQSEELAAQRAALEEKTSSASVRWQQLRVLEEECAKTVKRILAAEVACESGLSCQQCLQIFNDPVLCVPCGHTFCRACFEEGNDGSTRGPPGTKTRVPYFCSECDASCVSSFIPAKTLELLSGKYSYRCQQLRDLSALLDRELARQGTL